MASGADGEGSRLLEQIEDEDDGLHAPAAPPSDDDVGNWPRVASSSLLGLPSRLMGSSNSNFSYRGGERPRYTRTNSLVMQEKGHNVHSGMGSASAPFPLADLMSHEDRPGNLAIYDARWLVLAMACLPYFLTSWISYMFTANMTATEDVFKTNAADINTSLSFFFFGNVSTFLFNLNLFILISCFLVVSTSISFWNLNVFVGIARNYKWESACLTVTGVVQGIAQCPTVNVVNRWFKSQERSMCIGIIMNMNNVGIGMAYLAPGMIMDNFYGYESLSSIFLGLALFTLLVVVLCYEDEPPLPPTLAAKQTREKTAGQHIESPLLSPITTLATYWGAGLSLFKAPGFGLMMLANMCTSAAMYLASEYLTDMLTTDYNATKVTQGITGILFWAPNVYVCAYVGAAIDRQREAGEDVKEVYVRVMTRACTLCIFTVLLVLVWMTAFSHTATFFMCACLVLLGNALAIPQPISTEIALDVTYGHADVEIESVVVCLQMITTSMMTALLGYWISSDAEFTSLSLMYNMGVSAADSWDYAFPFAVTLALLVVGLLPYMLLFNDIEFNRSKSDRAEQELALEEQEIGMDIDEKAPGGEEKR